jgi:hypothetical protein
MEELQAALTGACAREELLIQELADARTDKEAFHRVIAALNQKGNPAARAPGMHDHIRLSQIRDCKNQIEGWEQLARLSGGFARPSDGAQLLIDAGLSKGKRRSVVSTASNHMSNSDDWERTDAGTYRWVLYGASDHDPAGQEGDEWPAELYPTGDGDASPHTYRANGETEVAVGRIIA